MESLLSQRALITGTLSNTAFSGAFLKVCVCVGT
jgi:hypothetical protein